MKTDQSERNFLLRVISTGKCSVQEYASRNGASINSRGPRLCCMGPRLKVRGPRSAAGASFGIAWEEFT